MANPRELAEQAFALLQNALRNSEERASELDEQLKRKRAPKNRLEEQLDVLTHRLENVEAERARWEQQAGHLEEIAEAERVKVAQLKKKLEIAESGPEKLTKKEINFWRAKAEDIDTETKEYKDRLTQLQREIMRRDAEIAELQNAPPGTTTASATPAEEQPDLEALKHQVQQRDQWLSDLRLELHDLRAHANGQPEPSLETLTQIETLRQQIAGLERALTEAHNTRAAAQTDLRRAEQELAARERAVREAASAQERVQTLLQERDHRLIELSAEIERLRHEERQREDHVKASAAEHEEQARAEIAKAAEQSRAEVERIQSQSQAEIAEIGERLRAEAAAQEERSRAAATELQQHSQAEIAKRDQQIATLSHELEALRTRAEQDRLSVTSTGSELEAARAAAAAAEQRVADNQAALARIEADFAERTSQRDEAVAAVERLEQAIALRERELEQRTQQLHELGERLVDREEQLNLLQGDMERAKATSVATAREITSLRETLQRSNRDLEQLREQNRNLEAALVEIREQANAATGDLTAAKEQIAGLEAELKEEKEHAENMGELANERREHMTKLQEQLEEAEERYAEASWRLGKAQYFERLVKRRKGLIEKLLAALRAKMKANVALKAGLDGLRTYKAAAEVNQQKLLQRMDKLKADLDEAEETIKRQQAATHAQEELANADSRVASLEQRLNTQAELIQSLETELKAARLAHKSDDERNQELEQLRSEIETKNQVIAKLEQDTDEQQRKLAKLRGSESETLRLKALKDKDRTEIDALQREVAQLREALARQSAAGDSAGGNPELEAALVQREESIALLSEKIKEHESTIKKLTESAEGWKRKYQFLSADEPEAYKSTAEH